MANIGGTASLCPSCRQPFTARQITRIFITFPQPAAVASENDPDAPAPELPAPPPLTDEQKAEATALSAHMSEIGVNADIEDLGRILSSVKLWADGVGAIEDMETQVCLANLFRNPGWTHIDVCCSHNRLQ